MFQRLRTISEDPNWFGTRQTGRTSEVRKQIATRSEIYANRDDGSGSIRDEPSSLGMPKLGYMPSSKGDEKAKLLARSSLCTLVQAVELHRDWNLTVTRIDYSDATLPGIRTNNSYGVALLYTYMHIFIYGMPAIFSGGRGKMDHSTR